MRINLLEKYRRSRVCMALVVGAVLGCAMMLARIFGFGAADAPRPAFPPLPAGRTDSPFDRRFPSISERYFARAAHFR